MSVVNNLTDEQAERFAAFEVMFGTAGWKLIQEWAEQAAEARTEHLKFVASWDEHNITRGQILILEEVAKMEQALLNEFETLAADNVRVIEDDYDDVGYQT